ncbi:hypothetical protein LTR17_010659 [Elasticomyces elasticus]|nr:hypothetical protein LTR17_010659 [Elasticomyces elasticus]
MTTSTDRNPQTILAPDDGDDDTWPPNGTSSALDVKRNFRDLGHKHWGFAVYRCTYGDNGAWEQLIVRLHRSICENLREEGVEELIEFLDIPIFEDAKELDGASKDLVRRRFDHWIATEADKERLNADAQPIRIQGMGTTPRYSFCLQVDVEALRSVTANADETPDNRDRGGFLNLIAAKWALPSGDELEELRREQEIEEREIEDLYDEGYEAVEGCKMQDVGWMRISIGSVMPGFYAQVLHRDWEFDYVRPPGIGG